MPATDYDIHVFIQLFDPEGRSATFGQRSVRNEALCDTDFGCP